MIYLAIRILLLIFPNLYKSFLFLVTYHFIQ